MRSIRVGPSCWIAAPFFPTIFVSLFLNGCEPAKISTGGSRRLAGNASEILGQGSLKDSSLKAAKVDPIPASSNASNTLYVSPAGTGDACSRENPCSLTQGRLSVRRKIQNLNTDFTVYLRGGLYQLDAPFVLEPEDSGQNGKFVVYSAFPGEVPILSGGSAITGWTLHDAGRGIFKAKVAEGSDSRQLYVNGVRAVRARTNVNAAAYKSFDKGWRTDDGSMASWKNITSIEVGSRVAWKSMRCPIGSIGNGRRNLVAISNGQSFSFQGDWLPNSGQGTRYHVGDFNGDGKSDLLFAFQEGSAWRNLVATSNGSSFSFRGDWLPNSGQGTQYHVGDFNGDGKSDLLFAFQDGTGWHNLVAVSNGSSFSFQGDWLPNSGQGTQYHIGDFNGDGKSDLLFAFQEGSAWRNLVAVSNGSSFSFQGDWLPNSGQGTRYHVGDFNGDGKSDLLLAFQEGSAWRNLVAISTGAAFSFQGDWLPNSGQGTQYHVADFNGDGKTDLLFAFQEGSAWRNLVAVSTGAAFSFQGDWLPNSGQGTQYHVADFNGDGKKDILFAFADAQISIQEPCWTNANRQQGVSMHQKISWIENAYELINEPGEWYLDKPSLTLYYLPRAGENLESASVMLPRLERIVDGKGRLAADGTPTFLENVKFIGLVFAYGGWVGPSTANGYAELQAGWHAVGAGDLVRTPGNVAFSTARNLHFIRNRFLHLGATGLDFDGGSQDLTIIGNAFVDVSGTGLQIGSIADAAETRSEKQHKNFVIANNYVTNTAIEYEGTTGMFFGYVANALLKHNEVFSLPYTGISMGWGWGTNSYAKNNKFEKNFIHRVMQTLSDGGGIYTLSPQPESGLVENVIDEVGFKGCAGGYNSIYHDEGSRYFVDTRNVVKNSCENWLSLWTESVQNNTLTGNFVDVDSVICKHVRGASTLCAFGNNNVSGNIFSGGNWPAEATAIMKAAGLEADYQDIK